MFPSCDYNIFCQYIIIDCKVLFGVHFVIIWTSHNVLPYDVLYAAYDESMNMNITILAGSQIPSYGVFLYFIIEYESNVITMAFKMAL